MLRVTMPPLRQVRRLAGFSLRALAQTSGVSMSAIGSIERGETKVPHPRTIVELARALQVAPDRIDEFRNGDDERSDDPTPTPT